MVTVLAHVGKGPESGERRLRSRHQAPLTYIELGEDNGGTVLNISEAGLAVQAVGALIDGQLPQIRFQFSECANWIETSGRIAWTSESKKVAGVEFVGLPEQAREQIREWISLDARLGRYPEEVNPTEEIVNLPTAGELASGNCLSESETSQTRPSVPSGRTSVASSETPWRTQLTKPAQDSAVIPERDSKLLKNAEVPNKRAANRSHEAATSEVRKGKEESNVGAQEAQQESKVRVSGLRNLLWLASSLALMALLTGVFFGLHSRHLLQDFSVRSGSPVESHLGLRLERAGSDWRFSWNPDAPAISKAMKGNLSITDGTFHKVLDLDSSDLQGGAIIYTPLTNDVVLRLEVEGAGLPKTVSESLRIAAAASPSLEPSSSPPVKDGRTDASLATSRTAPPAHRIDLPEAQPEVSIRMDRLLPMVVRKAPPASPSPISVNVKPAEAQVQPLAKPEEMDPPAAMRAIPTQPEPAAKFAPVEPERTLTATPAKELTQPASRLEAAQLLMRKEPVYPPLAVQSHVSGAVEVRFHIRVDGTVHDVTVIKGNPVLARAAIDAVEAWRYNPARLSGFPIETDGNAVLNFAK